MELSLDKYLERIGYTGSREVNAENLFALQTAHLMHVPYENLDIYNGRPVSLEIPALYEKIVCRRRGGYCFELNGLFGWLLKELGYPVEEYFGRWLAGEPTPIPARRHRVLRVRLPEGDFLPDVGIGRRAPLTPLRFLFEQPQEREGVNYRLLQDPVQKVLVQQEGPNGYENYFSFDEAPQLPVDFQYVNFYLGNHPDSIFRKIPMAHLPTEFGRNSLSVQQNQETQKFFLQLSVDQPDGAPAIKTVIQNKAEFREALKTYFGIVLS